MVTVINIIKSWSQGLGDWASWADATTVADAKVNAGRFGKVILSDKGPVLALDSFGKVYYAKLDMRGKIINPKDAAQTIRTTVRGVCSKRDSG